MTEYRTPEEDQAQREHVARVEQVLEQVVRNGVSLKVAMALGEPREVVERWVDAAWNGLRDGLSDYRAGGHPGLVMEDRLTAIMLLLDDRMTSEAQAVVDSLRDMP